jgi:hypothetical protein
MWSTSARAMPRPRASSAVCIDLISPWCSSSSFRAATPSTPPSRKLKNVTEGSRSPSTSRAKTSSGGVVARANARWRSSSARTSSALGSSIVIWPLGIAETLAARLWQGPPIEGEFLDDFDAPDLDTEAWVPHYLPQWSSRAESAATYEIADSELRLAIPSPQGLWCPADHDPLRVSGIQSGVFSGEVGSTIGQQPFRDGLVVREFQATQWGWTPHHGLLEVRARMDVSPRSMAGVWMVGLEDEPTRCGEILLFEVFGDAVGAEDGGPTAAVGMGVRPFRDPALTDGFSAPRLALDVAEFHVYAADWRPGRVDFLVDGELVKTLHQAPDYPMQMMIAVFDFPDRAAAAPDHVPRLAVDYVRGRPPSG